MTSAIIAAVTKLKNKKYKRKRPGLKKAKAAEREAQLKAELDKEYKRKEAELKAEKVAAIKREAQAAEEKLIAEKKAAEISSPTTAAKDPTGDQSAKEGEAEEDVTLVDEDTAK